MNRWLDSLHNRPWCAVAAVLVAALAAGFAPVPKPKAPRPDPVKEERPGPVKELLKRLPGEWELAAFHPNFVCCCGERRYSYVIKGDRMSLFVDGEPAGGWALVLGPSTGPKALDLRQDDGEVMPGIFELEGGTLTVCSNAGTNGKGRPADFRPREGVVIQVLKRAKKKP